MASLANEGGTVRQRALSRLSGRDSSMFRSGTTSSHLSDRPRSESMHTEDLEMDHVLLQDGHGGDAVRQSGVAHAAINIVAEVMGAGVLSLPAACAVLGWVCGLGSTVFFAVCSAYSGLLLTHCKARHFPHAESFADLAAACVGRRFEQFTRCAILLQWGLLLPYFVIACVNSLRIALPDASLCFVEWTTLAAAGLLLPLQFQTLHALSYAATLSTIAMVAATAIALSSLFLDVHDGSGGVGNHSLWPPALVDAEKGGGGGAGAGGGPPSGGTALLDFAGALTTVVFAYQGQSIYLEIMREMKSPHKFGRACVLANIGMEIVYASTVAVGYGARGDLVDGYLPNSMRSGPARVAVGWLLAFHLMVCYLITGQPLHRAVHSCLFASDHDRRLRTGEGRPAGCRQWLMTTIFVLLIALVVASTVPFFAEFQSLLGALTGVPTICGWPVLFFLKGSRLRGEKVPLFDRICCCLLLGVLMPLLLVLGTMSALANIASKWGDPQDNPIQGCLNATFFA